MLQESGKVPLRQKLTPYEKGAYEGALSFYYCFIPTCMAAIIFGHVYVVEEYLDLKDGNQTLELTWYSIAYTFSLIFGSIFAFFKAMKVYQICNQINIAPILQKHQISQQLSQKQNGEAGENTLLGGQTKPPKRFCNICQITCDYRTKHCRKCQVCVQRFDHHCFWIGNCVGRHNHRPFYLFLFFQTINNLLNFITLCHLTTYLSMLKIEMHPFLWWIALGIKILDFGFIAFTGFLLLYHTMLIMNGQTTWQQMKKHRITYLKYMPRGHNPFSKGVTQNWKIFFSQPTRYTGHETVQKWFDLVPTYDQAKNIIPAFNLIQNEYYSCC